MVVGRETNYFPFGFHPIFQGRAVSQKDDYISGMFEPSNSSTSSITPRVVFFTESACVIYGTN